MEIIDYQNKYQDFFKNLNLEWLEKYFAVEPIDHLLLSDPEKAIIQKGGYIYFARHENTIVGTVALLKINDTIFELSKMAVAHKYQGTGIGKRLLEHCIKKVKSQGAKKIILYSHTKLVSAIRLYKKYGFTEVILDTSEYKRANIKMELGLLK